MDSFSNQMWVNEWHTSQHPYEMNPNKQSLKLQLKLSKKKVKLLNMFIKFHNYWLFITSLSFIKTMPKVSTTQRFFGWTFQWPENWHNKSNAMIVKQYMPSAIVHQQQISTQIHRYFTTFFFSLAFHLVLVSLLLFAWIF